MKKLLILVLMIFAFFSTAVLAQSLFPNIPKATGNEHPQGNEFMRINHMDMLRHERDMTMREGIRDVDNSLAQCISCHVVKGTDSKPVTIESEEHFCRVCHDFAAVKLDCFSCHNSVPEEGLKTSFKHPDANGSLNAVMAYLEETAK